MNALEEANEQAGRSGFQREASAPPDVRPRPGRGVESGHRHRKPAAVRFVALAITSVAMYVVFFGSIDRLSPVLRSGTEAGAAVVIGLALLFCLVYGACANYFLELLGIRERR